MASIEWLSLECRYVQFCRGWSEIRSPEMGACERVRLERGHLR
jgi:hypothetical protein